jgi:hypothetical protein
MAFNTKITVQRQLTPCNLVENYQSFRGTHTLYHRIEQFSYTDVTDTTGSYETAINFYQTIRRHIPQDTAFTFIAAGLPKSRITPNGLQCQGSIQVC